MEFTFITLEQVCIIHLDQTLRYGGDTSLRDLPLLSSAVNMPRQMFDGEYVHNSIFKMASAYLFHIVNNHPFVDGNKRTGAATALQFLKLNSILCTATPNELVQLVLSVAKSESSKDDVTTFFQQNHKRI